LASYLQLYVSIRLDNLLQPEERKVITMNQQTPDRARQELRAIFGGIFDHVLRKEKETTILNASRMEHPPEKSNAGHSAKVKTL
jgi:hypothetical protein